MKKQNILLVAAINEEMPQVSDTDDVHFERLITKVGKVQAAVTLAKYLSLNVQDIDAILNIGTSGAKPNDNLNVGDIVICTTFEDRDMKPLAQYGTIFEAAPASSGIPFFDQLKSRSRICLCNTGDTFVTSGHFDGDVCDMEGFALAQTATAFDKPMMSVKYVSDIIGSNSVEVWAEMLAKAQTALSDFISRK